MLQASSNGEVIKLNSNYSYKIGDNHVTDLAAKLDELYELAANSPETQFIIPLDLDDNLIVSLNSLASDKWGSEIRKRMQQLECKTTNIPGNLLEDTGTSEYIEAQKFSSFTAISLNLINTLQKLQQLNNCIVIGLTSRYIEQIEETKTNLEQAKLYQIFIDGHNKLFNEYLKQSEQLPDEFMHGVLFTSCGNKGNYLRTLLSKVLFSTNVFLFFADDSKHQTNVAKAAHDLGFNYYCALTNDQKMRAIKDANDPQIGNWQYYLIAQKPDDQFDQLIDNFVLFKWFIETISLPQPIVKQSFIEQFLIKAATICNFDDNRQNSGTELLKYFNDIDYRDYLHSISMNNPFADKTDVKLKDMFNKLKLKDFELFHKFCRDKENAKSQFSQKKMEYLSNHTPAEYLNDYNMKCLVTAEFAITLKMLIQYIKKPDLYSQYKEAIIDKISIKSEKCYRNHSEILSFPEILQHIPNAYCMREHTINLLLKSLQVNPESWYFIPKICKNCSKFNAKAFEKLKDAASSKPYVYAMLAKDYTDKFKDLLKNLDNEQLLLAKNAIIIHNPEPVKAEIVEIIEQIKKFLSQLSDKSALELAPEPPTKDTPVMLNQLQLEIDALAKDSSIDVEYFKPTSPRIY